MSDMLQAALDYGRRGWRVFPCQVQGKAPLPGLRWQAKATSDEATIRRWWSERPNANIGLVTGTDGPGVVWDVDDRTLLEEVPSVMPQTRTSATGKAGWHIFYMGSKPMGNSAGNLPRGRADVRGDGTGYVIAPPSVHPNGERYRWIYGPDIKAAPMPQWLSEVIGGEREWGEWGNPTAPDYTLPTEPLSPASPARMDAESRASLWLATRAPAISGSGGHLHTFETCMHVTRGFDLSPSVAFGLLGRWNSTCSPPWKPQELLRKCEEAHTKGTMEIGAKNRPVVTEWRPPSPTAPPKAKATPAAVDPAPDWPAPTPVCEVQTPLPAFPVGVLPCWALDWARGVAEEVQVPVDLVAVAVLSAMSAAIAKKAVVSPIPNYREHLNLWTITVMAPSSRKSPVWKRAVAPIVEWEKGQREALAPEMALHEQALKIEHKLLEKARDAVVKASSRSGYGDARTMAEAEFEALKDRQDGLLKMEAAAPHAEQLIADDATIEELASIMAANSGRIAVLGGEASIIGIASGLYSGKTNIDSLLKGYSNEALRINRRGRDEYVAEPALTMGLAVQSVVLQAIHDNPAMRHRGFLVRFLVSVPESTVGHRKTEFEVEPMPQRLKLEYSAGMMRLLGLEMPEEPYVLRLDDEAKVYAQEYSRRLEEMSREGGEMSQTLATEWAGKLRGNTYRLAGILHTGSFGLCGAVSGETMRDAIKLGEYFRRHAMGAIASMSEGTGRDSDVDAVVRWLVKKGVAGHSLKVAKVLAGVRRSVGNADGLQDVLAVLEMNGWIRQTMEGRAPMVHVSPLMTCPVCVQALTCEAHPASPTACRASA